MSAKPTEGGGITIKTSIYIHIPYCKSKCRYCDFPSFADKEDTIMDYFTALNTEISQSEYALREIDTVFFGGGTPSMVNEGYIAGVLETINNNFKIKDNCEITIEANPKTLSQEKLKVYSQSGINRISMGMQSHDNNILKTLGRIHTKEDILRSVELVTNSGINNYNLDVMFALPNQSVKDYEDTLHFAAKLNPTHISAYSLIIEEGTPFYNDYEKGLLNLPGEEDERLMYHLSKDILADYGYERYEVSNYAKEGFICRHNKFCWDYEDYIGFGSAAHSLIKSKRHQNTQSIEEYIYAIKNNISPTQTEILTKEDMIEECIIMGLRKTEGVSLKYLKDNLEYDLLTEKKDEIKMLREHGLVEVESDYLYITTTGFDISDSITLKLI